MNRASPVRSYTEKGTYNLTIKSDTLCNRVSKLFFIEVRNHLFNQIQKRRPTVLQKKINDIDIQPITRLPISNSVPAIRRLDMTPKVWIYVTLWCPFNMNHFFNTLSISWICAAWYTVTCTRFCVFEKASSPWYLIFPKEIGQRPTFFKFIQVKIHFLLARVSFAHIQIYVFFIFL